MTEQLYKTIVSHQNNYPKMHPRYTILIILSPFINYDQIDSFKAVDNNTTGCANPKSTEYEAIIPPNISAVNMKKRNLRKKIFINTIDRQHKSGKHKRNV